MSELSNKSETEIPDIAKGAVFVDSTALPDNTPVVKGNSYMDYIFAVMMFCKTNSSLNKRI